VRSLCSRIADQKDLFIFHRLLEQVDEILSRKEKRLNPTPESAIEIGSSACVR
jgi:hypothetical protein